MAHGCKLKLTSQLPSVVGLVTEQAISEKQTMTLAIAITVAAETAMAAANAATKLASGFSCGTF